ncbi:MAG: hypothetical protein Q9183_005182, partial [Haloplaca sp. 2 TL-2023]
LNPLIKAQEKLEADRKQKREDREADEGIVADIDDITSEGSADAATSDSDGAIVANGASETAKPKAHGKGPSGPKAEPDEYVNAYEVYASISELMEKEKDLFQLVAIIKIIHG